MKCKNCKNTEEINHLVKITPNSKKISHFRIDYRYLDGIYTKKCHYCNCKRPEPETQKEPEKEASLCNRV